MHGFLTLAPEEQRAMILRHGGGWEGLEPVPADVAEQAAVAGVLDRIECPSCKYAALFLEDACFNKLRFTFLYLLCHDRASNSTDFTKIAAAIEQFYPDIADALSGQDELLDLVVRASSDWIPEFSRVPHSSGPPAGFNEAVWPCFVDSMCSENVLPDRISWCVHMPN